MMHVIYERLLAPILRLRPLRITQGARSRDFSDTVTVVRNTHTHRSASIQRGALPHFVAGVQLIAQEIFAVVACSSDQTEGEKTLVIRLREFLQVSFSYAGESHLSCRPVSSLTSL